MNEVPHGTTAGYRTGCRCDLCRAASRSYMRHYREGLRGAELAAAVSLDEPETTRVPAEGHGTRSYYVERGCRCDPCVQANRDYQAEWGRLKRRGLTRKQLRESGLDLDEYLF